jgi:hypothetical protein
MRLGPIITSPQEIQGWCDFENIYFDIVRGAMDNFTFLEVGAWLGKSTAIMGTLIKKSGKQIKFYTVDTWTGDNTCQAQQEAVKKLGGCAFNAFWQNIVDLHLEQHVHPIISESLSSLDKITDKQFEFIFLDGDHKYDNFSKELPYFFPHVRPGGYIGGHDFNGDVKRAVGEFFPPKGLNIIRDKSSWMVKVPFIAS